jgi:hypothetical protein
MASHKRDPGTLPLGIGKRAMVRRVEALGEVFSAVPRLAVPRHHRGIEDEIDIVGPADPERELQQVRAVGEPVDPAGRTERTEPVDRCRIERGALEHQHQIGTMPREGGTQPSLQRTPEHPVDAPGPLVDREDVAPHDAKGVAQGNSGSVVALIELCDEQEAGAGKSG